MTGPLVATINGVQGYAAFAFAIGTVFGAALILFFGSRRDMR